MFMYQRPRPTATRQATKSVVVPAPQGGINRVDGLAAMPPTDAIFLYNLIPSEYGTKVRTGYREWATDVGTGGIRTIIPFTGNASLSAKLFVATGNGIYDVTAGGTGFAAEIVFPVSDTTSGIGTWTNFVNDNGDYFILYTDETNGYYTYTAATDTWAKVAMGGGGTQISGVDPATFAYVTIFKNRVWFVQRNTGAAWYLLAGSIYGAATKFNFGSKFTHGGTLVGLYPWTVDGGEGIDDYLVGVASGGDVLLYKGTDPATATDWFLQGSWFVGNMPGGRRVCGSFSGELYLLSVYGLIPMTRLISGALIQQEEVQLTRKISPIINNLMLLVRAEQGWEVRLLPSENLLLVSAPARVGYAYQQYVYSLNTQGWSIYRDIPYFTGDVWQGQFYIGDADGRVLLHTGSVDNLNLAEDTSESISWSGLMSFQGYGQDGLYKREQFIRPIFLSEEAPSFVVEARYDYNLNEAFGSTDPSVIDGALWDVALWDVGVWTGDIGPVEAVRGADGMGRVLSVGIQGRSRAPTTLIKMDMMFDTGGLL